MKKSSWKKFLRDSDGDLFGWIIAAPAARADKKTEELSIFLKGYSRGDFIRAAEIILGSSSSPEKFIVINPKTGKYYPMTRVLYSAKHTDILTGEAC